MLWLLLIGAAAIVLGVAASLGSQHAPDGSLYSAIMGSFGVTLLVMVSFMNLYPVLVRQRMVKRFIDTIRKGLEDNARHFPRNNLASWWYGDGLINARRLPSNDWVLQFFGANGMLTHEWLITTTAIRSTKNEDVDLADTPTNRLHVEALVQLIKAQNTFFKVNEMSTNKARVELFLNSPLRESQSPLKVFERKYDKRSGPA